MNNKISIIGAGGLGRELRSLVERNHQFVGFYDDQPIPHDYLGDLDAISAKDNSEYLIAMGNPQVKKQVAERLVGKDLKYANLISHRSVMPPESLQGKGIVVCDGVMATVNQQLGNQVLVNLNATIGHDVTIGDYCSIMPGANISGNVIIGEATLIGSGAVILQGIKIGSNVKVGAGAVVTKDVPNNTTVIGVPARPI